MRVNLPAANSSIPTKELEMILQAALEAANPYTLVKNNLKVLGESLFVGGSEHTISPTSRFITLGLGKAAPEMMRAANEVLVNRVCKSVCVCKHLPPNYRGFEKMAIVESSHPVPDERSVEAGKVLREAVSGLKGEDLVILLLSGGGSALACLPVGGVSLGDIQAATKMLLKNGATINEMNTVRKHLDLVKGGGLLRMAAPARMAVLVLSDVVGSPLDIIASGPAITDTSSFQDALDILETYSQGESVSKAVIQHLRSGIKVEEEGGHTGLTSGNSATHKVIGSSDLSVDAAAKRAEELGFQTDVITYALTGEARQAGAILVDAWEKSALPRPFILFAGGETTVQVKGNGLGGRNLEVALGVVKRIARLERIALITLATDGEDGPTDAAGAMVTPETLSQAGINEGFLEYCLETNDSYRFFEKAGSLIKTGPTGTNVNDISMVIGY